jgi:hypothetical protein
MCYNGPIGIGFSKFILVNDLFKLIFPSFNSSGGPNLVKKLFSSFNFFTTCSKILFGVIKMAVRITIYFLLVELSLSTSLIKHYFDTSKCLPDTSRLPHAFLQERSRSSKEPTADITMACPNPCTSGAT